MLNFTQSQKRYRAACEVMPGGVNTSLPCALGLCAPIDCRGAPAGLRSRNGRRRTLDRLTGAAGRSNLRASPPTAA